jgi:hypothetical protein
MLESAGVDPHALLVLPGSSGTFVFPATTDDARPWPMYRPAEATPLDAPEIAEALVYLLFGIPDFDPIASGWLDHLPSDAVLLWDRQGWLSRARDSRAATTLRPARKLFLANHDEALEEFSAPDEAALFDQLPPRGYSTAVVKVGVDGCIVIDGGETNRTETRITGFPVPTSSTIGSGDAFAGALAAEIAAGTGIQRAALVANAAAAAFLEAGGDPFAEELSRRTRALVSRRELGDS